MIISKSFIEGGAGLAAGAILGRRGDKGGSMLTRRSRRLVSVEVDIVSDADRVGEPAGLSRSRSSKPSLEDKLFRPGERPRSRAKLVALFLLTARDPRREGEKPVGGRDPPLGLLGESYIPLLARTSRVWNSMSCGLFLRENSLDIPVSLEPALELGRCKAADKLEWPLIDCSVCEKGGNCDKGLDALGSWSCVDSEMDTMFLAGEDVLDVAEFDSRLRLLNGLTSSSMEGPFIPGDMSDVVLRQGEAVASRNEASNAILLGSCVGGI